MKNTSPNTPVRRVSCYDSARAQEKALIEGMRQTAQEISRRSGIPFEFTAESTMPSYDPRSPETQRADEKLLMAWDIPPWLVDPVYDTRLERLRWRLRVLGRRYRQLKGWVTR